MENISNLSVLFNILINGMVTVFIVLLLVYILGKIIIYFFDTTNDDSDINVEDEINKKIKLMEGEDAKVISYRKLD
jgi:Na+-transporting methylmalonyl-CoA/oxaloacetate decarboxylase gamma subunit